MSRLNSPPGGVLVDLPLRFRLSLGEYVVALAVSRDGARLVVGLGDGRLLGFSLPSGKEVFRVQAHPGGLLGLALSPDGRYIATCGQESKAKLWTPEGVLWRELAGGASWVEHLAWSPLGTCLATASGRGIRLWSPEGECLREFASLPSTAGGLAWRQDGAYLAAPCYGGVSLLPVASGAVPRQLAFRGSLISIAWSPDAKVLACGSQDCSVHFWRLATGADSQMEGYRAKPKALAWDSRSQFLATSGDAAVSVWDFRGKGPEGTAPILLKGHRSNCTQLAFSPRKGMLASGGLDAAVFLWEPLRASSPLRVGELLREVTALVWHPEHHTLFGADSLGTLCAWDTSA
jgi:WD40 repeat protein